ncbi:substrate binding domain-containing protein, partial [Candidatus Symbiopectobacterium sp. NZEC135]|nr:substrate binding domain-containing protein [Candidatus Symbiopectobacterium sp. NZEC135]
LLASVKEAESEITACSAEVHGRLRVGAPQTFGVKYLAPLWGKFVEENPQVKLDIILSDRVVDLVEEGYDVVIRIAQLPNSMLVCRPLAKTRMVLCASPAYLAIALSRTAIGHRAMSGTSLPMTAVKLSR